MNKVNTWSKALLQKMWKSSVAAVLTMFWLYFGNPCFIHFCFFRNFETFVTLATLPTRDYSGAIFWLAQRTCNDFTEDFRRNNAPWIFCGQRSNFLFMFNSKDHGWIWTRSQSFRRETSARFGENKHNYCNFHFKPMNIKTIFAVMNTS